MAEDRLLAGAPPPLGESKCSPDRVFIVEESDMTVNDRKLQAYSARSRKAYCGALRVIAARYKDQLCKVLMTERGFEAVSGGWNLLCLRYATSEMNECAQRDSRDRRDRDADDTMRVCPSTYG
jgi:hypothetical protein